MAFTGGGESISLARLRASLSLVLPISDASAVVAHLPDPVDLQDDPDALKHVFRSAQVRLLKERIAGRLRSLRRTGPAKEPGPADRLRASGSDAALVLALHLGTGLTVSELARMLDRQRGEIADDLASGRAALLEERYETCRELAEPIAAYRDAQYDRALAARLVHHRATCSVCRETLEAVETLDEQLLGEIACIEQHSISAHPIAGKLTRRLSTAIPLALAVVAIVVTLMATSGLAGALIGNGDSPLAATNLVSEPGEQGWIVYGTWDGGLQAFDPVSGQREVLLPEYYTAHVNNGANYLVSPNRDRVAIFAQQEVGGLHWATREVRIVSITGELISELEWQHSLHSGWPTGWINNDELLIASIPNYEGGETAERFLQRLEAEGRLRAVDIETGEQRVVFDGAVAQAIPSPDSSRLAIVRPRDPIHPGTTVDLWSVEDGVAAELLGSVEHTFTWTGGLLWSQTSDALYFGNVADVHQQDNETSRQDTFSGQISSINLIRMDRDGGVEPITWQEPDTATRIIGIDDGGTEITYVQFALSSNDDQQHFINQDIESGNTTTLDLPNPDLQFQPTQSGTLGYQSGYAAHPDGTSFMLHLGGDHYLPSDPAQHFGEPPGAIYLMRVDEDRQATVSTVISDNWPLTPLVWLTDDAINLPETPRIDYTAGVANPERVDELRPYAQLGRDSQTSPDGAAVPMIEQSDDHQRPYLWFPLVDTGRWIASQTSDLTWHDSSHAFLGVTRLGGEGGGMHRISQHSASQRGGSSIDGFFDPLRLDDQDSTRYAAPAASPNASRTSFFSVDDRNGAVRLWVTDWLDGTRPVYEFDFPIESAERIRPVSIWLDQESLIFVEPMEWSGGLPVRVALQRLDITQDDDADVDTLIELNATGRDDGIDLVDVAIQPGGDYLAWRVRHFADRGDRKSGRDSIHIAATSDVTDSIEIDRAEMANGLTWSPGGEALAIATGARIGVYSIESHRLAHVSNDQRSAAHPVWLSDRELWFNLEQGDEADVVRVRFADR